MIASASDDIDWQQNWEDNAGQWNEDLEESPEVAEEEVGIETTFLYEVGTGSSENRNDPLPGASWRGSCAFPLWNKVGSRLTMVASVDQWRGRSSQTYYILVSLFLISRKTVNWTPKATKEPTMEAKKVCSEMPVLVCALPAPEFSALLMLVGCAMADEDEDGDAMVVQAAEDGVFM